MSRMKTGLARPKPIPVGLTPMEKELLSREAFDQKRSQAELLRSAYFKGNWQGRLIQLKTKQRNVPVATLFR